MYKYIDTLYYNYKNGCKKSLEELLLKLKPMIVASINKYYKNYNEFEDLIQEGYIVLIKKIDQYNDSKGIYLLGYLKTYLKFYYLDKHKVRKEKMTFLNQTIGDEDVEIIDILPSDDIDILDSLIAKENTVYLYENILKLTERQREITIMFYISKMSIDKISSKLGISYRTVVNIKKAAIDKLRKEMIN